MIIKFRDILADYLTPEERARAEELRIAITKLDVKTQEEHPTEFERMKEDFPYIEGEEEPELPEWKAQFWDKRLPLEKEYDYLQSEAKRRYSEAKGYKGILEDIRRIVEAYTKEDYLQHLKNIRELLSLRKYTVAQLGITEDERIALFHYLESRAIENYNNCYFLLWEYLKEALELLDNEEPERATKGEALKIIQARVGLWYTPEKPQTPRGDEEPEPELPSLPKYDFVYPTDFQQNLTKASKKIFDSSIAISDLKQAEIDVTPNKKGVVNTFSVYVDMTAPELKGTENITEYDKSVHNMAVSIGLVNKHGFFTARELATALIHGDNPNNNRVSSQQIGAVTKSIEKQRHIDITIDWTEHIKLNHKGDLPEDASNFTVKDYMLPVREYTATIGGKTLHGYQFIDPVKLSPLYQYASSVGQIGQHPVKMLNIPINLDQSKLVIRDFLLEEIAHIKNNPKSWNSTISVEKLLGVAGENSQTVDRIKKSRLLKAVKDMLDYWKKEGYIKGYKENKANTTGKPIVSFTIEV